MTKIIFDFEQLKDFIDKIIEEEVGRCGDHYEVQYHLTEDGRIQYRYFSFARRLTEEAKKWKDTNYIGEIIHND